MNRTSGSYRGAPASIRPRTAAPTAHGTQTTSNRIRSTDRDPQPSAPRSRCHTLSSAVAGLGTLYLAGYDGNATYHSGQFKVQRPFSNGLTFLGAYTWSKAIDDTGGTFVGEADRGGGFQDSYNRLAEKGLAGQDIRHRFVFSYVYELPFGKGKPFLNAGAPSHILGNWQINGITTFQTGSPFTVVQAFNGANNDVGQRRPDAVGDPNRCHLVDLVESKSPCRSTRLHFEKPATDTVNGPFRFGNSGRHTVIGPGIQNWDFAAYKDFPFNERSRIQFRTEFFNLLNRPIFANPGATLGTAQFGRLSATSTDSREIQFALKLYLSACALYCWLQQPLESCFRRKLPENSKSARRLLKRILAMLRLVRAWGRRDAGRLAEAAQTLEKSLELNPRLPRVPILLAFVYMSSGRYSDAVPHLRQAFETEQEASMRLIVGQRLVECLFTTGGEEEAVEIIGKLRRLKPDDPDVLYLASKAYANVWNATVQRLLEKSADSYRAHQILAEVLETQEKFSEAASEYRVILRQQPQMPSFHYKLGKMLLRADPSPQGEDAAMAEFRAELEINPLDVPSRVEIGDLELKAGRVHDALKLFTRAVERNPATLWRNSALPARGLLIASTRKLSFLLKKRAGLRPRMMLCFIKRCSLCEASVASRMLIRRRLTFKSSGSKKSRISTVSVIDSRAELHPQVQVGDAPRRVAHLCVSFRIAV